MPAPLLDSHKGRPPGGVRDAHSGMPLRRARACVFFLPPRPSAGSGGAAPRPAASSPTERRPSLGAARRRERGASRRAGDAPVLDHRSGSFRKRSARFQFSDRICLCFMSFLLRLPVCRRPGASAGRSRREAARVGGCHLPAAHPPLPIRPRRPRRVLSPTPTHGVTAVMTRCCCRARRAPPPALPPVAHHRPTGARPDPPPGVLLFSLWLRSALDGVWRSHTDWLGAATLAFAVGGVGRGGGGRGGDGGGGRLRPRRAGRPRGCRRVRRPRARQQVAAAPQARVDLVARRRPAPRHALCARRCECVVPPRVPVGPPAARRRVGGRSQLPYVGAVLPRWRRSFFPPAARELARPRGSAG